MPLFLHDYSCKVKGKSSENYFMIFVFSDGRVGLD